MAAVRAQGLVSGLEAWVLEHSSGAGPFTSRLRWRLRDGGEATWESRRARKRGEISIRAAPDAPETVKRAAPEVAKRLRRLNWVAAGAFTIGGSLFAIGAAVAQIGEGNATTAASI